MLYQRSGRVHPAPQLQQCRLEYLCRHARQRVRLLDIAWPVLLKALFQVMKFRQLLLQVRQVDRHISIAVYFQFDTACPRQRFDHPGQFLTRRQ
jgi:hypothetical protein